MNQQNQESVTPLNVPIKRKRGRPRKEESAVQAEKIAIMPGGSENVLNSNLTASTTTTTDDCDDQMVGKVVTGVIEGTFNAGYLLNVQVADTDTCLRGLVFLPGRVAPVSAENDIAPHVKMVQRREIPIPVLNLQTEIHGSAPFSGQCFKQQLEPNIQVPMSEDQVLPTEPNAGISVSQENQSASTMVPMADISKNETSISTGVLPQGISEPGHESHFVSIMSHLVCHGTVKQDGISHELDASRQLKESSADGEEAKKNSGAGPAPINLVPTIENSDNESKESNIELNQIPVFAEHESNIELNQIPVSAEPESKPSEPINESIDNAVGKTDLLEDTNTKLTISKVDTSNPNGIRCTVDAKTIDVGSNQALETSQPESMPSEQIINSVPSESKFSSGGNDVNEKSDSRSCRSFGDLRKVDVNQTADTFVDSMKSGNQIGSDKS